MTKESQQDPWGSLRCPMKEHKPTNTHKTSDDTGPQQAWSGKPEKPQEKSKAAMRQGTSLRTMGPDAGPACGMSLGRYPVPCMALGFLNCEGSCGGRYSADHSPHTPARRTAVLRGLR